MPRAVGERVVVDHHVASPRETGLGRERTAVDRAACGRKARDRTVSWVDVRGGEVGRRLAERERVDGCVPSFQRSFIGGDRDRWRNHRIDAHEADQVAVRTLVAVTCRVSESVVVDNDVASASEVRPGRECAGVDRAADGGESGNRPVDWIHVRGGEGGGRLAEGEGVGGGVGRPERCFA